MDNPIRNSLSIASIGQPQVLPQPKLNIKNNVRRGSGKVVDYLAKINASSKQKKIAGIFGKVVGKSLKYNLKRNKLGLAVGAIGGYAESGKIGDAVSGMVSRGYHIIPGLDATTIHKGLSERKISDHSQGRDQVAEKLLKITKN